MVVIEIISLVLLIVFVGMWIAFPGGNYEPYTVICGSIFVATDIVRRILPKEKKINAHDLKLFEEYKSLFVENGVAEFYRQHDFLGSFREDYWRPLSRYIDTWHTTDHEFVDGGLNKVHKVVYKKAEILGMTIARYTVPIGAGHSRSVKPDHLPPGPTPEQIKKEAREINALVPGFIDSHNQFVRLANRKLY